MRAEQRLTTRYRVRNYTKGMSICVVLPLSNCDLWSRLDADAILSFANEFTVVGDISADVVKFILGWVTSRSDYDTLVAASFNADFASQHRPVISRQDNVHTLYTGHSLVEPQGHLICCVRKVKGRPHDRRHLVPRIRKTKVVITCKYKGCTSTCEVAPWELDRSTPLGHKNIVKVAFLQEELDVRWTHPESNKLSSRQKNSIVASSDLGTSSTISPIAADPAPLPFPTVDSIQVGSAAAPMVHSVPMAQRSIQVSPLPEDRSKGLHLPPSRFPPLDAAQYHNLPSTMDTEVAPALPLPRRMLRPVHSMSRLMLSMAGLPPDSPSPSPSPVPQSPVITERLRAPAINQRSSSAPERDEIAQHRTGRKRQNEATTPGQNRSNSSKKARKGPAQGPSK